MKLWVAIRTSDSTQAARATLTQIALGTTPQCVWHENETLLMDVGASLRMFGGVRGLKAHLHEQLGQIVPHLGSFIGVSMSISAMGAWLLAQSWHACHATPIHWQYALSLSRLHQRTDHLSVRTLSACQPYLQWLEGIGCLQMGHLRILPRDELRARTHTRLVQSLEQIEDRALWPYQPCQPEEHFMRQRHLQMPVEQVQELLAHLKPMVLQLSLWLQQHRWAVSVWEVRLFHNGRRRVQAASRLRIALSEPSSKFEALVFLLEARLQAWALPAVVTDLMVLTVTVSDQVLCSGELFVDQQTLRHNLSHVLDTLRTRLGEQAVRALMPHEDYRPEKANHWCRLSSVQPSFSKTSPASDSAATTESGPHHPAWLLPNAQPLAIKAGQPWIRGPLHLLHGPYRIETAWWDKDYARRDYFVAQDHQARHYWIYCEYQADREIWYLQGLFG